MNFDDYRLKDRARYAAFVDCILQILADAIHHHRYCDPAQTLTILLEFYRSSGSEDERALWLEQGKSFAEHDLQVWRIRKADRDDLTFVLATLQPFKGIEEVYPLCMDVVDRLEPGDTMQQQVSNVLGATGVVSGEFGHVEAESEQYARLGRYLKDPRPKVKAFVETARHHAMQSMAWEQRRAEQDVEQMRRDWS